MTVTLNAVPAVRVVDDPVLPEKVPGAAVSPGTSSCNLERRPGLTVTAALVPEEIAPFVTSSALTVRLPAVFMITLNVADPETKGASAGKAAFASVEVR